MPITNRDNWLMMLRGEIPEFLPAPHLEPTACFTTDELLTPNNCPNGPVKTVYGVTYVGSADLFNGALPKPGEILLDDITKWRDVIKNPDLSGWDWERYYKPQADSFDRVNKYVKCTGGDYFLTLVSFMGFEGALIAMYEEPEEVYALFEYVSEHYLTVMKQQLYYIRPDVYTIMDDDAASRAPFFSLETYRALVKPFHEKHAALARDAGVLLDRHDCGHCDIFVDDWVEMGIRSWNPAQVSNDLLGVKQRHGNRIAICGGWDNTGFLGSLKCDRETFRSALIQYVDTFAPGGGFAYCPGVSGDRSDPEVQARYDIIREVYFSYARDYYKTH